VSEKYRHADTSAGGLRKHRHSFSVEYGFREIHPDTLNERIAIEQLRDQGAGDPLGPQSRTTSRVPVPAEQWRISREFCRLEPKSVWPRAPSPQAPAEDRRSDR